MTTEQYTGPVTVDVDGKGRVTVQRQDGIYAWEAEGARRVNDVAGSQILALVLGGMALERMSREDGGDFVHPDWTELFDGPEAYFRWRDAQGAA